MNKRINIWIIVMLGIFAIGVIIGGVYAGGLADETGEELKGYLTEYFESGARMKQEIFLSSFFKNLKIFAVIFIAGFFKMGVFADVAVGITEGFVSGFTGATLIKLLGWRGFFIGVSSVVSAVVFVGILIIYSAYSVNFGISGRKKEYRAKKEYFIFSAAALTIFCIASFFDGYITTTFMEFIVNKV